MVGGQGLLPYSTPRGHVEFVARFLHCDLIIGDKDIEAQFMTLFGEIPESRWKLGLPDGFYQAEDRRGPLKCVRHRVVLTHDPDYSDVAYGTALHELGHAATIRPWVYTSVMRQTHTLYYLEALAWDWARSHAPYWTAEMEADAQECLAFYRRLGFRLDDTWVPRFYPPAPTGRGPWNYKPQSLVWMPWEDGVVRSYALQF